MLLQKIKLPSYVFLTEETKKGQKRVVSFQNTGLDCRKVFMATKLNM